MNENLNDQVQKKLRKLHLKDMAQYLEQALAKAQKNQSGHLAFLADIVDRQMEARKCRSLERRLKIADLPRNMTFDNFDFNFQPSLNVEHLKDLMALSFVDRKQPLLIFGKTGTGKTHIVAALGDQACRIGFKVRFFSLQKLLAMLYSSLADETTDEVITSLSRFDLLIIDNVGSIRTKPEYPSLLLDLISVCQDNTAFITTSSISLEDWGPTLGDPVVTHAIIDRLMHNAHVINIRDGLSYRTEGPNAMNTPGTQSPPQ